MELTYINVNGYLIPNLAYRSGEQMKHVGKYELLRRDYLKNHKSARYQILLLPDIRQLRYWMGQKVSLIQKSSLLMQPGTHSETDLS